MTRLKLFGVTAALASAFAVASPVSATTITFEGQVNTVYGSPITRLGFDIW